MHSLILIHLKDIIDILISSFLIYIVLLFIQQTRSQFVLNFFIFLVVISYLSSIFGLQLTREFFEPLLAFFVLIFLIVFQTEIRHFFRWISAPKKMLSGTTNQVEEISATIVRTVSQMAKNRMGGIIIFSGNSPIDDIVEGGFSLDGKISTPIILSIFDTKTPGHDGAILIENDRIKKFGLHLPLAENFMQFDTRGTRHRAAVGITERSDVLVVVVSEEHGDVSIAKAGELKTLKKPEDLLPIMREYLHEDVELNKSFWNYLLVSNLGTKILSLGIATVLWLLFFYK